MATQDHLRLGVCANTTRSDIGGYIVVDGLLDDSKSRYKGQPDQRKGFYRMTGICCLEELAKELGYPEIEDDEVTAQMVAEYTGIAWCTADRSRRKNRLA